MNTYVSWQRGFRGGGFNPRPASAAQVTAFNPEDLDSYEIGLKSECSTAGCALNIAAFYVKYTDLQLPSVFVDTNGSVTFPPLNAGRRTWMASSSNSRPTSFEGFRSTARSAISASSTTISGRRIRTSSAPRPD